MDRFVGQEDDRFSRIGFLDLAAEFQRIHVRDAGHGDDQIVGMLLQCGECFAGGIDMRHPGNELQVQVQVFPEDALGQSPVLFEDKGVVGTGNQQDFPDPVRHQIMKAAEFGFVFFFESHSGFRQSL